MKKRMTIAALQKHKRHSEAGFMGLEGMGTYVFYMIMTGVVGLVVYGLFGSSKLSEMEQAVASIRMQTQQMFTSSMDYSGLDNALAMKAGLIPKKLIKGGNLVNSWGGTVTVATGDDSATFTISVTNVPQDSCTKLATFQVENWLSVEVNSTAIDRDSSVATVADNCEATNTLMYTAR